MLSDAELQAAIDDPAARGEIPALDLVRAFLARIANYGPTLNAIVTVLEDTALADAERIDGLRKKGRRLPLDGMPVVLKDNIDVAGVRATIGSRHFSARRSSIDAFVVRRIRDAGAVILAKAHMHELAFGATSNSALGACRNPWDTSRIPGGSSGGSGASVAADLAIGALGTDTGGSIRLPATLNGITGLRPTFGAISNAGIYPVSPSFDTVGPMARSACDVRALFDVMRGHDENDPWSLERPPSLTVAEGVSGLRVGIVQNYFLEDAPPQAGAAVHEAGRLLTELGADVFAYELPGLEEVFTSCTLMSRIEAASTNAALLDGEADLSPDVKERLLLGREQSGVELAAMHRHMMTWRRDIDMRFRRDVDLLLTPGAVIRTPPVEGSPMLQTTGRLTRITNPWSFAGIPAISMPFGFWDDGMPLGVQIAAARWCDERAIVAAEALQSRTGWHRARPPLRRA